MNRSMIHNALLIAAVGVAGMIGSALCSSDVRAADASKSVDVAQGKPTGPAQSRSYHFIRAVAVDPRTPGVIFVATDNQGLLRSLDGGATWNLANAGLKNYLVYDVKISSATPNRLYAATWGGGVYQSDDSGVSWREINDGLGNTAAGALALRFDAPTRREILDVETSIGVYEGRGEPPVWRPISEGLRGWNGPQFQSLILFETAAPALYLGTERGLYTRALKTDGKARGWKEVAALKGKRVSALAGDAANGALYAGTVADGGLFISRDGGATWNAATGGLEKLWLRAIALHPVRRGLLYVATGAGVWKSDDGGETWTVLTDGLTDPDVRALAIDPAAPDRLYAGTHGALFRSDDGGAIWTKLEGLPFDPVEKQSTAIDAQTIPPAIPPTGPLSGPQPGPSTRPTPPAAFAKCNQCHGWTDPALNQKPTYWRTASNRRNWRATVTRMSEGTTISPEEQAQITAFLDRYTTPEPSHPQAAPKSSLPPKR
ncbi:MAG: hypothetical protein HY208_00930 [Nitrospirae bacterium]|nr:hypothetical protein [Nitrospirota bacterium]